MQFNKTIKPPALAAEKMQTSQTRFMSVTRSRRLLQNVPVAIVVSDTANAINPANKFVQII